MKHHLIRFSNCFHLQSYKKYHLKKNQHFIKVLDLSKKIVSFPTQQLADSLISVRESLFNESTQPLVLSHKLIQFNSKPNHSSNHIRQLIKTKIIFKTSQKVEVVQNITIKKDTLQTSRQIQQKWSFSIDHYIFFEYIQQIYKKSVQNKLQQNIWIIFTHFCFQLFIVYNFKNQIQSLNKKSQQIYLRMSIASEQKEINQVLTVSKARLVHVQEKVSLLCNEKQSIEEDIQILTHRLQVIKKNLKKKKQAYQIIQKLESQSDQAYQKLKQSAKILLVQFKKEQKRIAALVKQAQSIKQQQY